MQGRQQIRKDLLAAEAVQLARPRGKGTARGKEGQRRQEGNQKKQGKEDMQEGYREIGRCSVV